MKHKKLIVYSCIALAVVVALSCLYGVYVSRTKIATLNFPDFTVEKFIRSNNNPFIKIESVPLDKVEKISSYDVVLVRVHGNNMDSLHLKAIKKAIADGVAVFSTESNNQEINSLKGSASEYISTLIENGSVGNYRSLFNYMRSEIDKKLLFNNPYSDPVIIPEDYYFHLGEDQFFATLEEYQNFYTSSGKYKQEAPRVVLLSGNINMQNSNEEHIAAIINSLENKGLNVYPINSFGPKKLKMIAEVKPNIIISRPHGRLIMGGADSATELLKELNVPILAPVTVSELYKEWLFSKQGMLQSSAASMSVVMPELDGAIAPIVIAAQFERNGMRIFDSIPHQTEKFCNLVKNFTKLQTKQNSQKRIAIYYYKSVGKGTISTADMEGVQSLYNTLKLLKDSGYNVSNLPQNSAQLEVMIQQQGSVLGPYALGAYNEFIKNGNPALIDVEKYNRWAKEALPDSLIANMKAQYGDAPGDYMSTETAGKKQIAVARITFGNVAIVVQPLPSVGGDVERLVHGTSGAPAYPYVASYLWTRNEFKADALIHFGTHGSLEFIPGKQVALSNYDWTDALIGDTPHFYIYTINNIGEGIIAKRRSYATLISHLTAPYMQSELHSQLRVLKERLQKIEYLEEGAIKQSYIETITSIAKSQNILSALSIDSAKTITNTDIKKIHNFLEEIDAAKVNDGLYTLGQNYTTENLANTTRLISIDPIRYALAQIDVAHKRISNDMLDNLEFMASRYNQTANSLISRALKGESADKLLKSVLSSSDIQLLLSLEASKSAQGMGISHNTMAKMASVRPAEEKPETTNKDRDLAAAAKLLKDGIEGVLVTYQNLMGSTKAEQTALLNALSGGYISPSSGGDPIVNPSAAPTGRNFYAINPETTPSPEAWKVGKRLAENLLEAEHKIKGNYPQKVSFTLWSTDFISSEGATVAQILYLLGVEPLRDGFGYIRSLKLIPTKELGRPRIDVVVQTSGQLRDIASSRLELINRAVEMAAEDKEGQNFVSKGFEDAERLLLEKGFSPADARRYSKERIFGGAGGNYGTGITAMVERGDSWDSSSQIATEYIKNMGATYSSGNNNEWGELKEGVFEAALLNTSVVVQPRSSNNWGALSLDHVYEFMGGISSAIQHVNKTDPTAYFNDFRNPSRAKVQELKEAIGVETNSTLFNPKYISKMMSGNASAMAIFAETFRNTYGWNAMKPSIIDQHIWNKYYSVYVKDELNLGLEQSFAQKNPYALQEMTAVLMESARKGMWIASDAQLKDVAELHTKLVTEHTAGCSGFICDNGKLREFITSKVDKSAAQNYNKSINAARQVQLGSAKTENSVVLKKEEQLNQSNSIATNDSNSSTNKNSSLIYIITALIAIILVWFVINRKRSK